MSQIVLALGPGVVRTHLGLELDGSQTRLTDFFVLAALEQGAPFDELLEVGTPRGSLDARGVLDVLHRRRLLEWRVIGDDGQVQARIHPLIRGVALAVPETRAGRALEPSHFSLLRREEGAWLLESGRSPMVAVLSNEAAAVIASSGVDHALASALAMAGLLAESDDDGPSRYWDFHDRYFASRSRMDIKPAGGTFRFAGTHDPEPFGQPGADGERIDLPMPDGSDPGPGIWQVVGGRHSVRDYSDEPVPLALLGSLLWHTLRVRERRPRNTADPRSYDAAHRPVPSGGGTHSVGLWMWCERVEGVERGAWWYDPDAHALVRVTSSVTPLTNEWQASLSPVPITGLLISQHARVSWKYVRIAHAVTLKDSGVILHALQLGALAVGLGMCPVGSGPTAAVLNALGLDPDVYMPVGEFWLGLPQ